MALQRIIGSMTMFGVGAKHSSELNSSGKHQLLGVDVRIQKNVATFVEAEIARSQGQGVGRVLSLDGGLTHETMPSVGASGVGAEAYRVKAAADLNDLSGGALSGNVAGEVTHLRGGFSSDLAYAAEDTTTWNISGNLELGDQVDLRLGSSG